jgi:hypothetical protein
MHRFMATMALSAAALGLCGAKRPQIPWVIAKVVSVQHQSDLNATDTYDIELECDHVLYFGEARFDKVTQGPLFSQYWLPNHRPQLTENTLIRVQIKPEKMTVMDDRSREYSFLLVKREQEPIQ